MGGPPRVSTKPFALDDPSSFPFSSDGNEHRVYRDGDGPPVLILHELPGLTPRVVELAQRVRDAGFMVYLPLLFGQPMQDPGIVLSAMIEPCVAAPVMCEPGLPFLPPWAVKDPDKRRALAIAPGDLEQARMRAMKDSLHAWRFENDFGKSPGERFARLESEWGNTCFRGTTIPYADYPKWNIPNDAHAVLTKEFRDVPGHPTRVALDEILSLFRQRLHRAAPGAA